MARLTQYCLSIGSIDLMPNVLGGEANIPMTTHRRFQSVLLCAAFALISVTLVFWPRKRPEANPIPQARESVAVVGETTAGPSAQKTPVPTVVAETPTAVKLAPVAMVPPPVREAEDATAKVETLPRAEDYAGKTSAATLRTLADDPAANTVLRLSARHSLSLLAE